MDTLYTFWDNIGVRSTVTPIIALVTKSHDPFLWDNIAHYKTEKCALFGAYELGN